jgi:1-aminocyclopropane-1-carboxylate deaminase/D-cysteine desulfhydrase-like pyridoxal-dependent ACC family enzyme
MDVIAAGSVHSAAVAVLAAVVLLVAVACLQAVEDKEMVCHVVEIGGRFLLG